MNCLVCKKSTKSCCGGCQMNYYCSEECQIVDWNNGHLLDCIGSKAKVHKVMREFYAGKLHTSSGKLVTDKKQALAIALNQ